MWSRVKKWVVDAVSWAEREMKGKTGAEKREAVVNKVDALIPLPWFLEWLDGLVIGWLVDKVCEKMNWLTDHNFTGTELTEEQSTKLAEVASCSISSIPAEEVQGKTVEERLNALYKKYGINPLNSGPVTPDYVEALKDVYNSQTGDLSPHFSKKEFACGCGCGFDTPVPELIDKLEALRGLCDNRPLKINSACRCTNHNKAVGGAAHSQHLLGKAADVKLVTGMTVDEMAKKAEEAGFNGIGKYNWGVHVDVRSTPSRWDYRGK